LVVSFGSVERALIALLMLAARIVHFVSAPKFPVIKRKLTN
jgi:hypothetical protein